MLSIRRKTLVLTALAILAGLPAYPGTFLIQSIGVVEGRLEVSTGYTSIEIRSTARYFGTPDASDDHYFTQTSLNWASNGGDQYNWATPDGIGPGRNGNTPPFEGMRWDCGLKCEVAKAVPDCNGLTGNQFVGHAAIAIYHQYEPEIDSQNTDPPGYLSCVPPTPPGGIDRECDDTISADESFPGCSPIIVDLDNNGFHLTGGDDSVRFDFDGVGDAGLYGWTQMGAMDGFICLDRNSNGKIDNGLELFGNLTMLSNGMRASSGYEALAELDFASNGGNTDGVISSGDLYYERLRVWIDLNHNGESEGDELLTLTEAGVVELSYMPRISQRRDVYGNSFRFRAPALVQQPSGPVHATTTYDVFFASPTE